LLIFLAIRGLSQVSSQTIAPGISALHRFKGTSRNGFAAVENFGESTTTGVVGDEKIHKNSWKSGEGRGELPVRTGENRA